MASTESLGDRAFVAMQRTDAILEELAPERRDALRTTTVTGGPPSRTEDPNELAQLACYQAEQLAALAESIQERTPKQRGRGRPRKSEAS